MREPLAAVPAGSVPAPIRQIAARIRAAGGSAHAVGGCVRDLLLSQPPADFDIATELPVERLLTLFDRAIPIGLSHGTIMVPSSAGPVDISTYRSGRSLDDDLHHRDFTCNAIALEPEGETLHDPCGGWRDLAAGVLRTPSDADRTLADDPLRVLRAARFVSGLDLRPTPSLRRALSRCAGRLTEVAPERLRAELLKLLRGRYATAGLQLLRSCGAERALLGPGVSPAQTLGPIAFADSPWLRLALWLPPGDVSGWLGSMRFSRSETARITSLLRHGRGSAELPTTAEAARRALARFGSERVAELLSLRRARALAGLPDRGSARDERARIDGARLLLRAVEAAGAPIGLAELALDGGDVIRELGCPPGPLVGAALRHLHEQVLRDPELNRPAALRELLREFGERERDRPRGPRD
jgi:tRNA nucleotidyltransferase/poly(A) polymerase